MVSPLVLGAIGAAAQAAPLIIGERTPAARAQRKQFKQDLAKLRSGKLGLSAAQRRSMMALAQQAINAQQMGDKASMARMQAASGGLGRGGYQLGAAKMLAQSKAKAAAQAAQGINQLSQQQAQAEKARILQGIDAQAQRARGFWQSMQQPFMTLGRGIGASLGSGVSTTARQGAETMNLLYGQSPSTSGE